MYILQWLFTSVVNIDGYCSNICGGTKGITKINYQKSRLGSRLIFLIFPSEKAGYVYSCRENDQRRFYIELAGVTYHTRVCSSAAFC